MYENSINPLIAKKFTEDRSREYMNARRVSKEFEVRDAIFSKQHSLVALVTEPSSWAGPYEEYSTNNNFICMKPQNMK